MKRMNTAFLLLFISNIIIAQNVSVNIGLDTTNLDRKEIIKLWTNYLRSNPDSIYDNPYWINAEKDYYKSYDLLKSEGFIQPSLYYFRLDNRILSITQQDSIYIIRSMFGNDRYGIFAITNVLAREIDNRFYLSNYQSWYTSDWGEKNVGLITYHYF